MSRCKVQREFVGRYKREAWRGLRGKECEDVRASSSELRNFKE